MGQMVQEATKANDLSTPVLWLGWISLTIGLLLPLSSLPPFTTGYWSKGDPLLIGLYLSTALAALTLALDGFLSPESSAAAWRHPLIVIPFILALYSSLVAPITEMPMLSLLGAPQSGTGALWYVQLTLLIILGRRFLSSTERLHLLRNLAFLVAVLVAAIKGWDWIAEQKALPILLIWVPAYYAWLVPSLWLLLQMSPPSRSHQVVGTLILLLLMVVSRSMSVALAAVLGISGYYGVRWSLKQGYSLTFLRIAAALVTLLTLLAPILSPWWLPSVRSIASIEDRYLLTRMLEGAMRDASPSTWLFGSGWGRIGDTFQHYLPLSQQKLWDGQWIFLQSDYFHAHNGLMEALHASGLIGLLLFILLCIAPILFV
ncbi:hypothetical protein, partial [Candidatus Magnetaquicoccus inordinatus]|uniref:hypothetical protein n=1 Tax=Candidatus Magnetaquicoccus inordinatus TaxID=2496818 RepID=UPI00102B9730